MGKRAKRERDRRRLAPVPAPPPPPPPPAGSSSIDFAKWLGQNGIILVLFETPSGFAVFHYDGVKLFRPNALRDIWSEFIDEPIAEKVAILKEFQVFHDKDSAINSNGVCSKLAKMIKRWLWPGQRLAVGKCEYKNIIEASLGIHCLFNEAVLEVMWGLKYLMKFLVSAEEVELTNEDRFQMCQGLKLVFDLYGVEVEPKMLNSDIIYMASTVYESDRCVDKRASYLDRGRNRLSEVSRIDSTKWDELKLATALKLICYPEEEVEIGDSEEMLSKDEAEQLLADAHLYETKLHKLAYLKIYKNFVWVRGVRHKALVRLASILNQTRELKLQPVPMVKEPELKLHQVSMVKEPELKLDQGSMVNEAREEFHSSMDKAKEEWKLQQGSPMQMD